MHCILSLLCLGALGRLANSSMSLSLRSLPPSLDGNCGRNSAVNATCLTSTFGNCCSSKGFCGSSSAYCGVYCQSAFGTCYDASVQTVSVGGSCGSTSNSNITCKGSTFGDCCSSLGYCGGNSSYCGTGCQSGFGTCDEASVIQPPPGASNSSVSQTVSTSGSCGITGDTNTTCLTSTFGNCCSSHGFCGGDSNYCGAGCQDEFGTCDAVSSSSSTAHLSSRAKAGIGATIGSIALAVLILVFAYYFRRRRLYRRDRFSLIGQPGSGQAGAPTNSSLSQPNIVQEMYSKPNLVELGKPEPQELAAEKVDMKVKTKTEDVDDRVAAGYDDAYREN